MVDRDAHNYLLLVSWVNDRDRGVACDPMTVEVLRRSLPALSLVVWDSMSLLKTRMEAADRILFCEVIPDLPAQPFAGFWVSLFGRVRSQFMAEVFQRAIMRRKNRR